MPLQFNGETNILEYIHENRLNINGYTQTPIQCKREQMLTMPQYEHIHDVLTRIPVNEISREDVVHFYNDDIYTGFIAMMLWGIGNRTDMRGIFSRAVAMDRKEVINRLTNVETLICNNQLNQAYNSLRSKTMNKIDGLSYSFFTKILYFLGKKNNVDPLPLIFDQISLNIHAAILIAENQFEQFYRWDANHDLKWINTSGLTAYVDYINRMSSISIQEGIASPDLLEAALFGWNRRMDMNNPRDVVKSFIG